MELRFVTLLAFVVAWWLAGRLLARAKRSGRLVHLELSLVHYALVPPAYIVTWVLSPDPFNPRMDGSTFQLTVLIANVAFLIAESIAAAMEERKAHGSIAFHHFYLSLVCVPFILLSPIYQSCIWVGAHQINSAVHEANRMLRSRGVSPRAWVACTLTELVVFVLVRWVSFTPLSAYVVYNAFAAEPMLPFVGVTCALVALALLGLHAVWTPATVRRYRTAVATWRRARAPVATSMTSDAR